MKITIIAVGKIKENYLKDAIDEYRKRLQKFCALNIVEINESIIKVENESNIKLALAAESKNIIANLKNEYKIILDRNGTELSTLSFTEKIKDIKLSGHSNISFIIGGSYGLSDDVKKLSDFTISFSKLTFPHQLFRVILLEQIYRAFKIENNEPYHK